MRDPLDKRGSVKTRETLIDTRVCRGMVSEDNNKGDKWVGFGGDKD